MSRLTLVLIGASAACLAMGAPAPKPQVFYKPGWDKPVDPGKNCKFTQTKDVLTLELAGKSHKSNPYGSRLEAPHLGRSVKGNFRVQVRVRGDFRSVGKSSLTGRKAYKVAALLLSIDGDGWASVEHGVRKRDGKEELYSENNIGRTKKPRTFNSATLSCVGWRPPMGITQLFLRMERREDSVRFWGSHDGEKWEKVGKMTTSIPETVKVVLGILATCNETWKVQFDRFKLTPLPASAKGEKSP